MYVPVQNQPPLSPRARELSQKIRSTIEEFERHYPNTDPSDVREALQSVAGGGDVQRRRQSTAVVVGLLVALFLAGVVAFLFTGR